MPIDFPANPTNGQYHAGYIWNDASGVWDSAYAPRAATIPISSPNYIINGGFDIWQRGTSTTTSGYLADRFQSISDASFTASRQSFTPGTSFAGAAIEPTFFHRMAKSSGGSYSTVFQKIESVRTLAEKTFTVSFWAKADATVTVKVRPRQDFGSGGSTSVTLTEVPVVLSTSWSRYSATFTFASIAGKTIGTNDNVLIALFTEGTTAITWDIWGVQVEEGAAATDFRRNAPSIQGELAACQRYYWQIGPSSSPVNYNGFALLQAPNTVVLVGQIRPPVPMRDVPSSIAWTGTTSNYAIYTGTGAISGSPTIAGDRTSKDSMWIQWSGSGFTAGAFYFLVGNNTPAAYFGFNAEL